MKRGFDRSDRVADLIQKILAPLLVEQFQDDEVKLITITGVQVSHDLSFAKIYVSLLLENQDNVKEVIDKINDSIKPLRHELAQAVRLRITPDLKFVYDESVVEGFRISKLINNALKEKPIPKKPTPKKPKSND